MTESSEATANVQPEGSEEQGPGRAAAAVASRDAMLALRRLELPGRQARALLAKAIAEQPELRRADAAELVEAVLHRL